MMWNLDLFRKDVSMAVLASGSAGNAAVVCSGEDAILVDCGLSATRTLERLAAVGVPRERVRAVLVTHEHGDHVGGVDVLARKLRVPVLASAGTLRALRVGPEVELRRVQPGRATTVGPFDVEPFRTPHDGVDPLGFVVGIGAARVGFATDIGRVSDPVVDALRTCAVALLEFNHDEDLLARGSYPPWLKARIGGSLGHLSNRDGARLLRRLAGSALRHVVLGHLSRENNTPDLALAVARAALRDTDGVGLSVAGQDAPTAVIGVPGAG